MYMQKLPMHQTHCCIAFVCVRLHVVLCARSLNRVRAILWPATLDPRSPNTALQAWLGIPQCAYIYLCFLAQLPHKHVIIYVCVIKTRNTCKRFTFDLKPDVCMYLPLHCIYYIHVYQTHAIFMSFYTYSIILQHVKI